MTFKRSIYGFVWIIAATLPLAGFTQDSSEPDPAVADSVAEELKPQPELGPRLLSDISEEAQAIRRQQLMQQTRPVLPPIPDIAKNNMFTSMMAGSPMSMREMFNFMASKKKAAEGLTFDDIIEAMDLKANEVNFKKVGHNKIWQDVGAISGLPTLRVEILQYCDAMVGRKMLDFSPEFVIFIPCRIAVMEDANGDIWLMTLDWNVTWLAMAWHPDSQLGEELKKDAVRIRDSIEQIMHAGATGEW
jgi:uncharacterized protein (DUF302 family)